MSNLHSAFFIAAQNMPFIMKSRGLSRAIGMSQLLDTSKDIKVRACGRGEAHPCIVAAPTLLISYMHRCCCSVRANCGMGVLNAVQLANCMLA